MALREFAGSLEDQLLAYVEGLDPAPRIARTPEVIELEKELNQALEPWAKSHDKKYKHIGVLPYLPSVFSDQRINQPGREVTVLTKVLPEKTYMKLHKKTYVRAVGSLALANEIIETFKTTPAFEDEPNLSLVDYVASSIQENEDKEVKDSIALASGHLDRLSDITDLTDGLNIAVAEEYGLKYSNRFKVVVNKLMTRETMFGVPIPNLIAIGLAPRWGIPEIGAKKWDISEEAQNLVNGLLATTLLAEQKRKSQVVGIVPAGTAAMQIHDKSTVRLEKLHLPHSSAIASLFPRYKAIIPANRWENKISVGSVIPVSRPEGMHIRQYSHELTDHINYILALQASELAGVPVEFESLKAGLGSGIVAVQAVSEVHYIDDEAYPPL